MVFVIIISIIAILIVHLMMKINVKELEKRALDENLNKIAEKYPDNKEICQEILKKLKNENVKIEEDKNSNATLYIAIQNKISIGDTHNSFTRIQTMAHECLHSIQDRKMLLFNFIYSNIYFLYYVIILMLIILRKLPNEMLFLNIFLILSFIYYVIRIFLENDAMIKAEYVAKEYMEEKKISTKEEIEKVVEGLKTVNDKCIKGTNGSIFIKIMIKVILFGVLALIF
jgi:ABC-type multidrug transport system fused ATPase/permease subunit